VKETEADALGEAAVPTRGPDESLGDLPASDGATTATQDVTPPKLNERSAFGSFHLHMLLTHSPILVQLQRNGLPYIFACTEARVVMLFRATLEGRLQHMFESGGIPPMPFLKAANAAPLALVDDLRAAYNKGAPGEYQTTVRIFLSAFYWQPTTHACGVGLVAFVDCST
jgi:hypothetical protein